MNVSMDKKKEEAVSRMEQLGIFPPTVQQFKDDGVVSISEPTVGAFFWADEADMARIHEFESTYNALVYMVIRSKTDIGMLDSYLFVGDHPEEWEMDHEGIKHPDSGILAYVYNHDAPDCSEMGYVGVEKTPAAGLRRTW